MAFLFGLIHGLGFAGALAETPLPRDAFLTVLFSFNVGVELGQLLVVLLALPLLNYIAHFSWHRWFVRGVSSVIALLGVMWMIERLWGV